MLGVALIHIEENILLPDQNYRFSDAHAARVARGLEPNPFEPEHVGESISLGRRHSPEFDRIVNDVFGAMDGDADPTPPGGSGPCTISTSDADAATEEGSSAPPPTVTMHAPMPVDPRLSSISLRAMQKGTLVRGTNYAAFKNVPQVRGITIHPTSVMKTDGRGNVLAMPWPRVPRCFGDIISITMWRKTGPLGHMPSPTGGVAEILSRCTRCKVQNACGKLRRERVHSDPELNAEFDTIQNFKGTGREKIQLIKEFALSVSQAWRWYTMENERARFVRELIEERRLKKNHRSSEYYTRKKVAMAKPDPLSFRSPALEAERKSRLNKAASMVVANPTDRHLRYLTVDDVNRITATWYARELVIAAGSNASAGKVAKVLTALGMATKEGEALRQRAGQDFKFITLFETPGGSWS